MFSTFNQKSYNQNDSAGERSREWIVPILNYGDGIGAFRRHFRHANVAGIVYRGGYDSDSIVCWNFNNVIPLDITYDGGETWMDANKITKNNVANYVTMIGGNEVSGSSEWAISHKRALDIIDRAGGLKNTDDIIEMATDQLGAIRDSAKFETRKEAFLDVFAKNERVVRAIERCQVRKRRWY